MAINFSPKVGEILFCRYGHLREPEEMTGDHHDYRMSPEMVKYRPVLILNGREGNGCIVVPISSKRDEGKIRAGVHIDLGYAYFNDIDFADPDDSIVKANLISYVSKSRLFKLRDRHGTFVKKYITNEQVTSVQQGVVAAINAKSLLANT